MTRNAKVITVLCVLAIWLYLIFARQEVKADPAKSEKQIYAEKWAEIGELKYEEREMTRKAQEAKAKKDALLEDLNSTNEGLQE